MTKKPQQSSPELSIAPDLTANTSKESGDMETVSAEDAEARLPTDIPELPEPDVPADAPLAEPGVIRLGNREFIASPQTFAGRRLDVLPDLPDIRDRIYQPHLKALPNSIYPSIAFKVRDQGASSSCTGFALSHIIDCVTHREMLKERPRRASARMLYELAKRNDEWTGTAYEGSSIRGAISGFYRNGVCVENPADGSNAEWILTYERAKEARETRLGSYYRLQPDLSDYHAALNDVGAIYASAQIHQNWNKPLKGRIEPSGAPVGGHAFAIVGYDSEGFWILNSWGSTWGDGGIAHWRYEDWAASVMDAWVLQLGVRAPTAFSAAPKSAPSAISTPLVSSPPNRGDIVGHFINIDDGRYITGGRYGSPTAGEMGETVRRLSKRDSNSGKGYDHLVIYAHGGLNTLDDEARRIATWKRHDIFGRNRIYNFHLMWGSGLVDEAFGPLSDMQSARAAGLIGDIIFETGPGKALGSRAWRNMKQDAVAAFSEITGYNGGFVGPAPLLGGLDKAEHRPIVHLVGHSAGSIILGQFLGALGRFNLKKFTLGSIHLMAPACTSGFFDEFYGNYLNGNGAVALKDKIYLYNLNKKLELSDTVAINGIGYGRSLLHLVSRSYEEMPNMPLTGMELFAENLPKSKKLSVNYSNNAATKSTSHGGFDNDPATLTTIMSHIIGGPVPKPPKKEELLGY